MRPKHARWSGRRQFFGSSRRGHPRSRERVSGDRRWQPSCLGLLDDLDHGRFFQGRGHEHHHRSCILPPQTSRGSVIEFEQGGSRALDSPMAGCSRRWPKTPAGATSALPSGPGTSTGFRPPPGPGGGWRIPAAGTTTSPEPAPWNQCSVSSRPARSHHDVPPRLHRLRKTNGCSPPPPTTCASCTSTARGQAVQGPVPGRQDSRSPKTALSRPISAIPDFPDPPHRAFGNRLIHTSHVITLRSEARDCRTVDNAPGA
jgi:hypothetical protein